MIGAIDEAKMTGVAAKTPQKVETSVKSTADVHET